MSGVIDALKQPTLQRRSVAFVLVAFVVIWAVLLGYMYSQTQRNSALAPPLQKFGEAFAGALEEISDPGQAAAVVAATEQWTNIRRRELGRLPGQLRFQLLDAQGRTVYASRSLDAAPGNPAKGLTPLELDGQAYMVYHQQGMRWTVRVVEPVRSAQEFLLYNSRFLVEYLLLALPFVVIPVWLSVRNGLRPLQQLAQAIALRKPGDLSPVGLTPRHLELKPLAAALDNLLERLRREVARQRVFVQDAAHEIRTPLAVITAQAHVMANAPAAQERQDAHKRLNQAIARASHLSQQLLLLATLDDMQRPATRRIDVAQAVRELLAQAAPVAMARGIELSLDAPDSLCIPVDEPALESIVLNLVDNAVRYGRSGGNVTVTLHGNEERLTVQVRDDGPGIPQAEQPLVFERFYRGSAGQDVPGSGLGLAIVRQAAARMGGSTAVTAGLGGRGVGFLVSVPVPGFVAG
jgi:two-component system sensor histidine kinase QseC